MNLYKIELNEDRNGILWFQVTREGHRGKWCDTACFEHQKDAVARMQFLQEEYPRGRDYVPEK